MANVMDTFTSITQKDYGWPYPVPLRAKPAPPPNECPLYLPRSDPDDCKCDVHGFETMKSRYKKLTGKEKLIKKELLAVNHARANLITMMLESNCESADKIMKSVYQTDYEMKSTPIGKYRSLMAAVHSPTECPMEPIATNLQEGYRDPTRFRYSAIEMPTIEPAQPLNLMTIPESFALWNEPFTGRSEYMDTISKMGLSNMKNRQQYLEPHPSSRRRFGDTKL